MFNGHIKPNQKRWRSICPKCNGERCKYCKGKGVLTYEGEPEINSHGYELFEAYKMLKNYKIWPINAGWREQDALLIDTINLCDSINGRYLQIVDEENKATEAFVKRMGNGRQR